jgi:hypothetical protein
MALSARSIITLDDVKWFLDIPTATSDIDEFLERMIDWVSGAIEDYIGGDPNEADSQPQKIMPQDVELILDGNGNNKIVLPYAITSIQKGLTSNLQFRNAPDDDWHDLVPSLDFVLIEESPTWEIKLLGDYTFPQGRGNIRIAFVAAMDPVPTSLQLVCLEWVVMMYKKSKKGSDTLGVASSGISGAFGVTVSPKDITPEWEKVLRRYRKRRQTIQGITL